MTNNQLCRLTNIGKSYIDEEFLKSDNKKSINDPGAWEPFANQIKVDSLRPIIDEVIQTSLANPYKTDSQLARSIHKNIKLPRRFAMDTQIWHYLTCIKFPDYLRYRWTRDNGNVSKERFLGGIKRNALARLWWAAEILNNGDDYSLVKECFDNQDLYEALFGRSLSKFPPAAKTFVRTLKDEPRKVIRTTAKSINLLLSTFVLEDLPEPYFQSLIQTHIKKNTK